MAQTLLRRNCPLGRSGQLRLGHASHRSSPANAKCAYAHRGTGVVCVDAVRGVRMSLVVVVVAVVLVAVVVVGVVLVAVVVLVVAFVVVVVVVAVALVAAVVVAQVVVFLVAVDEVPQYHVQDLVLHVEVHDVDHVRLEVLEVHLQVGVAHANSFREHSSDD